MRFLFAYFSALFLPILGNALGHSDLRLAPHSYGGIRGSEPNAQLVGLFQQRFQDLDHNWDVALHFEGEALGRRDVSLDIDRAWFSFPISESELFYVGRIHPFDISNHPAATQPWSLLGSLQPQNRGILLGYGYGRNKTLPEPVLLGWVGLHFWSDRSQTRTFQWGLSVSPLFVPTMGSEVTFSQTESVRVGRFGRRPPGTVEVDGKLYPIHFEIDRSRIWQDVLFQPQVLAQLKLQTSERTPQFETWLNVQRAPNPEPTFSSSEYLLVRENSVEAFAKISPRFEERFSSNLAQRWNIPGAPMQMALMGSLWVSDDHYWGYEFGAQSEHLDLSFMNEETYSAITKAHQETGGRYADLLAQAQLKLPMDTVTLYTGVKRHLSQEDFWILVGVRTPLMNKMYLDSGLDLFSGSESSYFGEWRTNDRISFVLSWEFDS